MSHGLSAQRVQRTATNNSRPGSGRRAPKLLVDMWAIICTKHFAVPPYGSLPKQIFGTSYHINILFGLILRLSKYQAPQLVWVKFCKERQMFWSKWAPNVGYLDKTVRLAGLSFLHCVSLFKIGAFPINRQYHSSTSQASLFGFFA